MTFCRKIIASLLSLVLFSSSFVYSFAEFEQESGKDHIVGTEAASPSDGVAVPAVYASYEKDALFNLYNETTIDMYDGPSTSSKHAGTLPPQKLVGSKRKGDWFLVDTYVGQKWIYNSSSVQQRELVTKDGSEFNLTKTSSLYSEPFTAYPLGITIPAGTYKITYQAGDWFYVEDGEYTGWFTTTSGNYVGAMPDLGTTKINNIPLKTKIGGISSNVRPGYPMKPKYITIHNTANTGRGANASAHANLLYNGNNGNTASWHYSVDDTEIYQSLPLNEIGYHAGDGSGPGNRQSIGIEICENSDGNYLKAEQNAAELTAQLLRTLDLPLSAVMKHQDFSGKYCPARILGRNDGWNDFMNKVKIAYDKLPENPNKATYYLDIHSFLGLESTQAAMDRLTADTGWWLTSEETGAKEPVYKVETGGFIGEESVNAAINTLKETTGIDGTVNPTGNFSGGSKTPIYRVETGSIIGEENVIQAMKKVQEITGWWLTYEAKPAPNEFKIVTGGFVGEESANVALKKLQDITGWWATSAFTGSYHEEAGTPIYSIIVNDLVGESKAIETLNQMQEATNWWAYTQATGKYIPYYRIKTGGFVGLENAKEKSAFITENYKWYHTVNKQ